MERYVSIPKRVSEVLKLNWLKPVPLGIAVSIPKRVSEVLKRSRAVARSPRSLFQSLKGFQRF